LVVRVGKRLGKIMFCNEQNIDLYLNLRFGSLLQVCKELNINYSHALKLLKIWGSLGLIERNKAGFGYNVFYTLKGRGLLDQLKKMKTYMKKAKIQWGELDVGSM